MAVAPIKEDLVLTQDIKKKYSDGALNSSQIGVTMPGQPFLSSRIVASCPNLLDEPVQGDSMLTVNTHRKLQISVSSDGTTNSSRSRVDSYSRWQSRHSSTSSDPPKINIVPFNSSSTSTSRDSVKSSVTSIYSSNEVLDLSKVIPTIRIDDSPKANFKKSLFSSSVTSTNEKTVKYGSSPWNFMNVREDRTGEGESSSTASTSKGRNNVPPLVDCISEVEQLPIYYGDQNVSQILDFLFVGNIEAAYNEPLLCRLNINTVIDMSNILPKDVPRSKVKDFPCSCPSPLKHSRARLNISINNCENEDITPYFQEVNNFLEGARLKNRNVLVHGNHGRSRCIAAVIQYLMQCRHMNLDDAYHLVKKRRPGIQMNAGFQRALEKLELKLHPGKAPSFLFDTESSKSIKGSSHKAAHQAWV
ncbi:dual specificity protein phosphatase 10-like [Ptychodera flava]|uniref:dual specificity protein phosphatase 10-like n=1 Tax=Ptychodera flava TaxID=63121 RepID=UPI00396A4DA8